MDTPIKLKQVLEKNRIGLREFARATKIPVTTLHSIVNKGEFTQKGERDGYRGKIAEVLLKRGVAAGDVFAPICSADIPADDYETEWEAEMITQEAMEFFNMGSDPFERLAVAGPDDIFKTAGYKKTREALTRAITRRGFIAVFADVGAGKTLLWADISHELGDKVRVIKPVILEKEQMTVYNLQEAVIADLKGARADYSAPLKASKEARDRQIRDLLTLYDQEGIDVILIIEEAHTLPLRTLKALKRLWEIQIGFAAPLAIVLLGQPELRHELWDDLRIREVTRRCRLVELPRLRKPEIPAYIAFKFARVGEKTSKVFTDAALKAVADILKAGAPALQVNNLCVHAINQAQELGQKKIDADLIYALKK